MCLESSPRWTNQHKSVKIMPVSESQGFSQSGIDSSPHITIYSRVHENVFKHYYVHPSQCVSVVKWLGEAYFKYKGSSVGNQPDWWCSWPSCSFHFESGIGVRTAAIWGRGGFWGPGYPGFYWLKPHSPHAGNCGSGSEVWGSALSKSWHRDDRDAELHTRLSLNFVILYFS